ncbi:MAG TPA: hypothetical protein VMF30_03400 [Pirellulales bacterium]|nr:hypothetical protein [Pirellulales bacterium]
MVDSDFGTARFERIWESLVTSGLVPQSDEVVRAFYDTPNAEHIYPTPVANLGRFLVGRGVLTHWQFEMICQGKSKGFFELPGHKLLDHLDGTPGEGTYLAERLADGGFVILRVTQVGPCQSASEVLREFPSPADADAPRTAKAGFPASEWFSLKQFFRKPKETGETADDLGTALWAWQTLGKSGLVPDFDEMKRAYDERPESDHIYPTPVTNLGRWLIGRGILTPWQFGNIRRGKSRGFFDLPGFKLLDHLDGERGNGIYLAERIAGGARVVLRVTTDRPGEPGSEAVYEFQSAANAEAMQAG